jgi:hypothetical protein
MRLRAASVTLMEATVPRILFIVPSGEGCNILKRNTDPKAIKIFERIPADDTKISPLRRSGMLLMLTGTGFAQPNPTRKSMRVPIGSMCRMGLRLSLPIHFAVGSPIR